MKTLGVFTGGIGDTLLAGPAFAALHQEGTLDLAGNTARLALIHAANACGSVFDLDRIAFHTIFENPSPKLRAFLRDYDRVIVWMRDDGAIMRSIAECGVANVRVHPGLPPEDWSRHASEYYLTCIGETARREPRPPIRITKWEGEAPAEPRRDVIIHPGSGGPKKNWPVEHFSAIAAALRGAGRQVAWLRGPAEADTVYPTGARILETGDLLDLAKNLASARLYIGNDSGVTHLAAATGCKTIAVFGPTDASVWAPRGSHVSVLSAEPWPTSEAVLEALGIAPH